MAGAVKNRYAGTAGIPVFVSASLLFSARGSLRACRCMVFAPDRLVANRQSSRRCAFLLPPLFLSRYYVLLVSLLHFSSSFVSLWWLYGGRQQRVWQPSHPLFGGRRTRC